MAAIHRLLTQTRRHSFPFLHRSLCSSSSSSPSPPPPPNDPIPTRPVSHPIKPVSYPIKPISQHPDPNLETPDKNLGHPDKNLVHPDKNLGHPDKNLGHPDSRNWTREDARFVRDYNQELNNNNRVAPLPEDKVEMERMGDEMEVERRKIEAESRVMRRVFRVEEQAVPFPRLIKDEGRESKKGEKVVHDLKEAVRLVKENAKRNFDETLEAHVKLATDLRRTDLKLTGSLSLPHGSGKSLRVAVFAEGTAADEARAAGADMVGGEDLIQGIKTGSINIKDIDKCIATPQLMPRIGKEISKKLSRLTPNARDGSVTTDISRAVKEAKKNITFKKDKSAIVHVGLGKVSFTEEALCENVGAFVNALLLAKPPGLKKSSKYAGYVTTFHICSTMGSSYPVSIQSLSIAADRYTKLQMR